MFSHKYKNFMNDKITIKIETALLCYAEKLHVKTDLANIESKQQ